MYHWIGARKSLLVVVQWQWRISDGLSLHEVEEVDNAKIKPAPIGQR